MLSEDWESRYYSFNCAWNAEGTERMASMRNGCGDDWFIVFKGQGVFVKSFWHEYERGNVAKIYAGLPPGLEPLLGEAAFSMEDVTFGGFWDGARWTLRGEAAPLAGDLAILSGDPSAYRAYASEYFEASVPKDVIAHVLAGRPLDAALVARVSKERTLAELDEDLAEIGYGLPSAVS